MYYNDYYVEPAKSANSLNMQVFWLVLGITLLVGIGIVLYYTVFNKKVIYNNKFMKGLYDLVHFKYFVISDILKIAYIFAVLFVVMVSFKYIGRWQFLIILFGGNLILRIVFEFIMLFIDLCNNVKNISNRKK